MKRVILFILLSIGFALGLRAQMVNNIPNYLYSGSLGVGRTTANDANVYLQVGPNGAGTKGMIVPWVADTAAISGTKRNFLFIRSSQLAAFAYWDSVNARWYKIGFTDTTTISTRLYAQKIVDDSSKVLRALASAVDGVTSVATGYGISGGTITSTGTLTADTSSLSTKLNTQKVVDDSSKVLRALIPVGGSRLDQITGATTTATVNHAANAIEWQWNTATGDALKLTSTSTARTGSTNSSLLTLTSSGANANASANIRGLYANISNTGTSNQNYGGQFYASGAATVNVGVLGDGATYGVYGQTTTGYGVNGYATSGGGRGVQGTVVATTGTNYGVRGDATGSGATTNYGGYFNATGATTNYGVYGSGATYGVYGVSTSSIGVYGETQGSSSAKAVAAIHNGTSGTGYGFHAAVYGAKTTGYGIYISSEDATYNYGIYVNKGVSQFNDAVHFDIATKTADYTAAALDHTILADCTSGNVTITLPAVSAEMAGRVYIIKRIDNSGNSVTVDGNASETIDGATTYSLATQYKYVKIQATSTAWFIIGNN
jgi:hypothetical protein